MLTLAGAAFAAVDHRAQGKNHYFNLEYDAALRSYYQAIEANGEDAHLWNNIATTILYRELHRLGKLETSAFKNSNAFLDETKPKPDPQVRDHFFGAIYRARKLADQKLSESPDSRSALLALAANYALEANFEFMIDKAYFSALRDGNRARKYCDRLRKEHPDYVDALLIAGVQEYVIGSLPWAIRTLIAFGGIRGDKERGQEWVMRVAEDGGSLKTEAQMLLTLLHRRERRPLEAAAVLRSLIEDYPRNYVLRLELGSMHLDANEPEKAFDVFSETLRMVREDEQSFGRMPERLQKALAEKVERLQEQLQSTLASF